MELDKKSDREAESVEEVAALGNMHSDSEELNYRNSYS